MQRIVGSRLQERRTRITEVRKLRVRMEEIARPSSPYGDISPDEMVKTGDDDDSGERTKQEGICAAPSAAQTRGNVGSRFPRVTESVSLGARDRPPLRWKPVAAGRRRSLWPWPRRLRSGVPASTPSSEPEPGSYAGGRAARGCGVDAGARSAASAAAPARERTSRTAEKAPGEAATAPAANPKARGGRPGRARSTPARATAQPEEDAPAKRAEPKSKAPTKLARDPYGENQ